MNPARKYHEIILKTAVGFCVIFICCPIFGQLPANYRVDIYLIKKYIPCWDSTARKYAPFTVTLTDLEDTAFIKNEEIVSYNFHKYRAKGAKWKPTMVRRHSIETSVAIDYRIERLQLTNAGCPGQFAIVCNHQIMYAGCLHNIISSSAPPMVYLTAYKNSVLLDFQPGEGRMDPRENRVLFDCLAKTNRLKISDKRASK